MTVIAVNAAETLWLSQILGTAYTLHLYTNDVTAGLTPAEIDLLEAADFTEATFPGYAEEALDSGDWTVTAGDPTIAANLPKTFTRSSTGTPQIVRGYYITIDGFGDALVVFEAFPGPFTVEFLDDAVTVTPTLTLEDEEGNVLPTGSMVAYGAETPPTGWLICNGDAVSRTTFAALFAVIGTAYGVGDGSTTFNLPDTRQRFILGQAAAGTGATLGEEGGAIDHVHGLDTSTSGAHVRMVSGDVGVRIEEKAVAAWTSTNSGHPGLTGAGDVGGLTTGARLAGDSDIENPPYLVTAHIIKT